MTASGTTGVEPAEFDIVFRAGFGQLLMDGEIGKWNTTFIETDVGIVDGGLPASPANAIALASYGVSDDPTLSDSTLGLQVTTRTDKADPRPTARLTSKVYDLLHGMAGVVLPGGVYVVDCYRQSWTNLGQDENNRWREVSNFYVTVHRPSKYRS